MSPENSFNTIVCEIADLFNRLGKERLNQEIFNYLNNHNITSKVIYNWLLNNQNNSNAVFLLGAFNYLGIETNVNKQKAFELYQRSANLGNVLGVSELGDCYYYGVGTSVDRQKAFELYQKAANLGNASGMNNLGYCYQNGIGTRINE